MTKPLDSVRLIRDYLTVLLHEQGTVLEETRREYYEIMREECQRLEALLRVERQV